MSVRWEVKKGKGDSTFALFASLVSHSVRERMRRGEHNVKINRKLVQ